MRPALLLLVFLLVAARAPLLADELLQRVQGELRTRKVFFGEVDGKASPETKKAIEEFQHGKGIDATGEVDDETLVALGLKTPGEADSEESRALRQGRTWLAQYWQACESGDWAKESAFYAERVRYYYEGEVDRDYLREQRLKYYALWPERRQTALLCYASFKPEHPDELWVSARVRNDVRNRDGARHLFTEELLFKLRQHEGVWQLIEVGEWTLDPTKVLK